MSDVGEGGGQRGVPGALCRESLNLTGQGGLRVIGDEKYCGETRGP